MSYIIRPITVFTVCHKTSYRNWNALVVCNGLDKRHTEAKQLTEKTKPRIPVAIAALTYEKNNMGHTRQYQGLLAYNNSGIRRNKIEEPLVGWIVVETTRARH